MRRRKELTIRRIALLALLPASFLLTVAAALGALTLWLQEPAYWQRHQQRLASIPRAQLQQQAQAAEASFAAWLTGRPDAASEGQGSVAVLDRLAKALEGRRPLVVEAGPPRAIGLTSDQINAWLSTQGRPWLDRHGLHVGGKIQDLMLAFEEGRVVIAFQVTIAAVTQVVSLINDVSLQDHRKLHIKLHEVRGGTLGVRSGSVADPLRLLEGQLDPQQRSFLAQLRQGITVDVSKVLQSADANQQVIIQDLQIKDEDIRITLAGQPSPGT